MLAGDNRQLHFRRDRIKFTVSQSCLGRFVLLGWHGPSPQRARSLFMIGILPGEYWPEVPVAPFRRARYDSRNETLPERCRIKSGMTNTIADDYCLDRTQLAVPASCRGTISAENSRSPYPDRTQLRPPQSCRVRDGGNF